MWCSLGSCIDNLQLNQMICNNVNEKLSSSYVFHGIPFGCVKKKIMVFVQKMNINIKNDKKECKSCLSPLVADYE